MAELLENTGIVCGVLMVAELIARLCPKNKMLSLVQSLTALVLVASLAGALAHAEWRWPAQAAGGDWQNQELNEYVEEQYVQAARQESETWLKGLLAAAGLEAKKITADINIMEDGRIELTRAAAEFRYADDARRAQTLLRNALGTDTAVEVTSDGA